MTGGEPVLRRGIARLATQPLHRAISVGSFGIEPKTSAMSTPRSNQLSYEPSGVKDTAQHFRCARRRTYANLRSEHPWRNRRP